MPALVERPKMSLVMWSALKTHIMKQREKKKQEQEADAAIERLRREQELKRRQDAMTLEEIKDQLARMEHKLSELKEEKHQLFLQLKKVLNEDETRRRALVKEPNDMIAVSHGYHPHALHVGAPPPLYMPAHAAHILNRAPTLYKMGIPPQQNVLPPGSLKRPRSPSPPAGYPQGYNYKTHVTNFGQKPTLFHGSQVSAFYAHGAPVPPVSSAQTVAPPAPSSSTFAPYPSQAQYASSPVEQAGTPKHVPHPAYHLPQLQQPTFVNSLQQQLEQANQKAGFSEEKFYAQQQALRGNPLTATQAGIPLQQAQKTGGITSGFPVRVQPPPPTSANHFPPSSNPHSTYSTQQAVPRIAYPGQTATRYF